MKKFLAIASLALLLFACKKETTPNLSASDYSISVAGQKVLLYNSTTDSVQLQSFFAQNSYSNGTVRHYTYGATDLNTGGTSITLPSMDTLELNATDFYDPGIGPLTIDSNTKSISAHVYSFKNPSLHGVEIIWIH